MRYRVIVCFLATAVAFGGGIRPTSAQSGADFSRVVFVGDSLTAGYQDGALHAAGQINSYAVLVAQSIGTPIVLPLIDEPGVPDPNPATFTGLLRLRPGVCSVAGIEVASGRSAGRIYPTARATDVAVPGQDIGEALTVRWSIDPQDPATVDTIEDLILGLPAALEGETPASQIETAVRLRPTFVVAWLGSNDVLGAALRGTVNDETVTPLDSFRSSAHDVFAALGSGGTQGVILNIPDVTTSPFLFSVREIRSQLDAQGIHVSSAQIRTVFGIKKGSSVILTGLESIAQGRRPTPDQILTKRELRLIRTRTSEFNDVLRAEADELGWAYVDINAWLSGVARNGVAVPGVGTLTTDYLGGIFSLDGVHPTNSGQALIAGLVIDAINLRYGTAFLAPDVATVAASDPETCGAIGFAKRVATARVSEPSPRHRSATGRPAGG